MVRERGTMRDHSLTSGRSTRSRQRFGLWLALFALLVQFVASFGHIHAEDFQGLAHGTGAPVLSAGGPAAPSAPANPWLPTHDDCAICIALHMASGALPAPPVLVAPAAGVAIVSYGLIELHLVWPAHLLFQTRGPPHA